MEMADSNIACVIVVVDGRPVGIFSERDVLHRVSTDYKETLDKTLADVMTVDPVIVYETDHPSRVLNLMAGGGFRHLPVVDADGKLTGMIGARRVTDYLQQHLAPSSSLPARSPAPRFAHPHFVPPRLSPAAQRR